MLTRPLIVATLTSDLQPLHLDISIHRACGKSDAHRYANNEIDLGVIVQRDGTPPVATPYAVVQI